MPTRPAICSRIEPLKAFARKMRVCLPGVLSDSEHEIRASVLERINDKVKAAKRIPEGFHDDAGFFLKVRGAFL